MEREMDTTRVLAKAIIFFQVLLAGCLFAESVLSQTLRVEIEFLSGAPPVIRAGTMKHSIADRTDTQFVGNFIAPAGYVVCTLRLTSLTMVSGRTVPSFGVALGAPNNIRYQSVNGTSRGDFGLGTKVNPKPAANIVIELVPENADRSGCHKLGQVFEFRGANTVSPWDNRKVP
jgi:hypothetical protein